MVATRRGAGSLGCLVTLLIVGAVVYYGVNVGEIYWRGYQFEDDMRTEVRFAANVPNDSILTHLRSMADSLGLPDDAQEIDIHRTKKSISIDAEYDERIVLPMHVSEAHFHPHADGPL